MIKKSDTHDSHIFLLIILTIALFFLSVIPVSAVYIAGIEPNPPGTDHFHEWVAIFNPSNQPVNISGWYVADDDGRVVCVIPKIWICPKSFYRCLDQGLYATANLGNTVGDNVTLYDNLGNPVSVASQPGGFPDTNDDNRIWWNNSGTWVYGYYIDNVVNVTILQGKVWSTNLGNFYDSTLKLSIHTCYQRNLKGSYLNGVKDMIADAEIRINKSGTIYWLNYTINSTQIHYNVHFIGGQDVSFIPPYMLSDLSEPRKTQSILEEYYLHLPVEGLKLTGWNVGDYWLLSGVAAKEKPGKLFNSTEIYVLFFRTPGASFGPPPSGNDYLNLTKKLIYYRTKIIEDVWRSMEFNGIWDTFWNNLGSYLNSYVKIWSAIRHIIKAYIP